ncbi:hypothetical protein ASPWEDRAFT_166122 [Aspergillus wentii DTO 134E9]|uniref:AMP-dependent synthetase/ligase domain-containing protein n=1 Tax=Aspergillus wentii DTO 134E9 TaxID=1073089 RepID=A0A1L9RYP6_ASPWE|nr:uncharacterized protein ASPWEDRAFT_166122 [Aspergillus wentii DTO 134E9]KAI9932468.1 hypothetical protein MW887_008709 [Aspergillus wentii]OJJ40035.1 hypothetical protein ASPWEDRAFT_166122 [Aspergillus wentii DTO 134E9]
MGRLKVTDASLTPVVVSQIYPRNVPTLKSLSIGGDAPTKEILSRWSSQVRLNNVYGTTETGVWDTVRSYMSPHDHPKHIGKGIGVTCWIVDPSNVQKLRPVGLKGELLIQCPYLGQGYLN